MQLNKYKIYIIIFVILLLSILLLYHTNEHFAGALLQLYAKGPQDYYLTGNESLFPYYYPNYYSYNDTYIRCNQYYY